MNSPVPTPIPLRPRSMAVPASLCSRSSAALRLERLPVALIVDDCHFVTRRVARALTARKYETVVAADGYAGLQMLRSRRFDFIVLDVDMPMLNGLSLLQQVRHDPNHAAVPVLMLGDLDSSMDREQALELGADAYMTKPLQLRPLYAQLEQICRS